MILLILQCMARVIAPHHCRVVTKSPIGLRKAPSGYEKYHSRPPTPPLWAPQIRGRQQAEAIHLMEIWYCTGGDALERQCPHRSAAATPESNGQPPVCSGQSLETFCGPFGRLARGQKPRQCGAWPAPSKNAEANGAANKNVHTNRKRNHSQKKIPRRASPRGSWRVLWQRCLGMEEHVRVKYK